MRLASARSLLITFIPSICILAIAAAVGAFGGVTMDRLTRDVVAFATGGPHDAMQAKVFSTIIVYVDGRHANGVTLAKEIVNRSGVDG